MEKNIRLRNNKDFKIVYKRGKSYWNRNFSVVIKPNNLNTKRIGFSITKKYGKAVSRNKIKRRLRHIVDLNLNSLKSGYDIVIIPRQNTLEMNFKDLEKSLLHIINIAFKSNKKG